MVFNEKLRKLIAKSTPKSIVMHDWWIILLCKAAGLKTVYGKESKILYRQHGNNSVGLKKTWPIKYWAHCVIRKSNGEFEMLSELQRLYKDIMVPCYATEIEKILKSKERIGTRLLICADAHYRTYGKGVGFGKETIGFKLKILFGNL